MTSVILDAVRTPIGAFNGAFKDIPAPDLAAHCIKLLVERNSLDPRAVDDVIMGIVVSAGVGQIPSRQAALKAGLPPQVPSLTVNKVCASGMRAVTLASTMIEAGDAQVVLAGGMENMSRVPYASFALRRGARMGHSELVDLLLRDGLWCAFDDVHMAHHGERVAKEYGLTREECDAYALHSQQSAQAAITSGRLDSEITPYPVPQRKGEALLVVHDEQPRADTSLAGLAKLNPVLGTEMITAGNAPSINDGGAALVVCSDQHAKSLGKRPLAVIRGQAHVAMEPYRFPIAPAFAIRKLLTKTGCTLSDIHLWEVNEAFAAVVLACGKELDWDTDKVNVNGGAIAFGHPIGMSGARIIMTLAYELNRRGGGLGIAAICSGSGQGDAILLEV